MKDIVIVSACRTAIGAFGGTLKNLNGAKIASVTMKEAIKRAGIDPALIDDVRYGTCIEHHDTLHTGHGPCSYCKQGLYFGHGSHPFRGCHDSGRYG